MRVTTMKALYVVRGADESKADCTCTPTLTADRQYESMLFVVNRVEFHLTSF